MFKLCLKGYSLYNLEKKQMSYALLRKVLQFRVIYIENPV